MFTPFHNRARVVVVFYTQHHKNSNHRFTIQWKTHQRYVVYLFFVCNRFCLCRFLLLSFLLLFTLKFKFTLVNFVSFQKYIDFNFNHQQILEVQLQFYSFVFVHSFVFHFSHSNECHLLHATNTHTHTPIHTDSLSIRDWTWVNYMLILDAQWWEQTYNFITFYACAFVVFLPFFRSFSLRSFVSIFFSILIGPFVCLLFRICFV